MQTLNLTPRRCLGHMILLLLVFFLSGCRYWSLYQFGDQFCAFDRHLDIQAQNNRLHIRFLEPVLPRKVFLRYLNAQGYALVEQNNQLTETFYIQRSNTYDGALGDRQTRHPPFEIVSKYRSSSETFLLQRGILGPQLSQLFVPALVEPILKSICSEDYDLGLSRIEIRSELANIDPDSLPTMQQFIATFGLSEPTQERELRYQFDFLANPESSKQSLLISSSGAATTVDASPTKMKFQNRPIHFILNFNSANRLKRIAIDYHKYDYWLDFETLRGGLVVIRDQES